MRRARRPRRIRRVRTSTSDATVGIARLTDAERLFRQLLQLERLIQRKDEIRRELLKIAEESGSVDEKGSQYVELTTPLTVGDTTYKGFVRRRKVSTTLDEDRVRQLAEEKGITDLIYRQVTITELDTDALYACQQEGRITEAELESCIRTEIKYALEKIK